MPKKRLTGTVMSKSGDKSVVVEVTGFKTHPVYKKRVKRNKKYMAHNEENKFNIGDVVTIEESRPLSKRKKWIVAK